MRPTSLLVTNPDRLYATLLCESLRQLFPAVSCQLACTLAETRASLAARAVDLLISGVRFSDGDVLGLLGSAARGHLGAALIVAEHIDARTIVGLRSLGVNGVFDSAEDEPERLSFAAKTVLAGRTYWSPSLCAAQPAAIAVALRILSPTERLVLGVIGDGSDNTAAATFLGMTCQTIQTVRRSLHGKLGVHQRGDLMGKAVELGFVHLGARRATRVGFGLLLAAYHRESKRPVMLTDALAAEYPEAAAIYAERQQQRALRVKKPASPAIAA